MDDEDFKKRKIFYKIFLDIFRLNSWILSVYRSNMPMTKDHAGIVVKSLQKSLQEIINEAQNFIDILEGDNNDR